MMKNVFKLSTVLLSTLTIVACNGGGGGSQPTPEPTPAPFKPVALPYTYSIDHPMTGESYAGGYSPDPIYPTDKSRDYYSTGGQVADLRPFGQGVKITYTFTNPYESMPIWFTSTSQKIMGLGNGGFYYSSTFDNQQNSVSTYRGYMLEIDTKLNNPVNTCQQYTESQPLQPHQTCKMVMNIITQYNYTESELLIIPNSFGYFWQAGAPDAGEYFSFNTPVRAGIWYQNQQGYGLNQVTDVNWIRTFHAINYNGSDYVVLTENVNAPMVKVSFDANGVAQIDMTNNVVSCSAFFPNGCAGTMVPPTGQIFNPYKLSDGIGPSSGSGGRNGLLIGLNGIGYGRSGGGIPNMSKIFAVQPDGTAVGQNTNGQYGCFNNDGTNFRPMVMPLNASFIDPMGIEMGTLVGDTISYGSTNWIEVYDSDLARTSLYKVVADNSGTCTLDGTNIIGYVGYKYAINFDIGGVSQQVQITPNGVYGYQHGTAIQKMQFYKYPPRQ